MTRCFAEVIGDPVAQSKSPLIHNFWLEKLGIAGEYHTRHVRPADLAEYLASRRDDELWRGCNVTMPHKQAVLALLAEPGSVVGERDARRIGAVNTVVRRDSSLHGLNTDYAGFFEPLALRGFAFALQQRALILGNGGAARAILVRLDDARATSIQPGQDSAGAIALAVREFAKGEALLRDLTPGKHHIVVDLARMAMPAAGAAPRYDLVVNASPLGMTGQPPLNFDLSHVAPGGIVYDIVYSPLETPLLAAARARGLVAVDGLTMLIGQAAVAFRLFFGADPPRDDDEELRRMLTA